MSFPEIGWHNLICEIFLEDTFSGQDKYIELSFLNYSQLLDTVQSGKLLVKLEK